MRGSQTTLICISVVVIICYRLSIVICLCVQSTTSLVDVRLGGRRGLIPSTPSRIRTHRRLILYIFGQKPVATLITKRDETDVVDRSLARRHGHCSPIPDKSSRSSATTAGIVSRRLICNAASDHHQVRLTGSIDYCNQLIYLLIWCIYMFMPDYISSIRSSQRTAAARRRRWYRRL